VRCGGYGASLSTGLSFFFWLKSGTWKALVYCLGTKDNSLALSSNFIATWMWNCLTAWFHGMKSAVMIPVMLKKTNHVLDFSFWHSNFLLSQRCRIYLLHGLTLCCCANMQNFGAGDYSVKNVHFLVFCLTF